MSAITGIWYRDGKPALAETLQPAMDVLAHYGNDGSGVWTDENIGFGHQHFAITPESKFESQPYARDGLVITADARIDNRDELARHLRIEAKHLVTMPESEVILRAYEKWGQECAGYLLGDFAFAIWDENKRELFCARDHVGARPFYYYDDGNIFAFATEINGILAYADIAGEIDEGEIARFLIDGTISYYHRTRTFFKNLYKLRFAYQMVVNDSGVKLSPHWNPGTEPELQLSSEDEYAEMMIELLHDAVACRVRTDRKVGSHLTGGLDSSSVAVTAARQLRNQGRQLYPYSWSPPLAEGDKDPEYEQHRINAICEAEGLECRYLERTARDQAQMFWEDLATTTYISSAVERALQRDIQADGVHVMLTGWGGDEAVSFNGRGYPSDLLVKGRWLTLFKLYPSQRKVYSPLRYAGITRRLLRSSIIPLLPDVLYRQFSSYVEVQKPSIQLMSADFEQRISGKINPPEPLRRSIRGVHNSQIARWQDGHLTARIESWAKQGAKSGIVYSYPLLDKRLMEIAYRIPDYLFRHNQQDRYIFRLTIEKLISPALAWSDAKNEPGNLSVHERLGDEVYDEVMRDFFHESQGKENNPWVDVKALEAAIYEINALKKEDTRAILCALQCLTIWEHQQTRQNTKNFT